ncbi:ATP-binding protein [Teichococcus aestuarii]|uniref:ATP-binding protein n=1 Tax=Teichococcus aestuarii TaxID=568898 RepID=UPI003618434B
MSPAPQVDYRRVYEALPGSFLLLSAEPSLRILAASEEHLRVAMVQREAILGQPFFVVFTDSDPQAPGITALRAALARVLKTGEPERLRHLRYALWGPAGSLEERWWNIACVPVRDPAGSLLHIVVQAEDVTAVVRERQHTRETVRGLEERLSTIFNQDVVGIAFAELNGRYIAANERYCAIVGRPWPELRQFRKQELAHPDDRRDVVAALERVSRSDSLIIERRYVRPDGGVVWTNSSLSVAHDAAGAPEMVVAVVQDISARKATEAALERRVERRTEDLRAEMLERQRAEAALRQAQKMQAVGQLTGGIAHDFNNMLTGIIGSIDIMRRRLDQGDTVALRRYLEGASGSARRAAALTNRLLAFSRQHAPDSRPLDVNALIDSLQELLTRTLGEQVVLRVLPVPDLPLARADANQLESALLNLVINARDAMPQGGALTIETAPARLTAQEAQRHAEARPGTYVRIAVSDTGIGMPPEVLARVFEPFFTTKPPGQGTGLGLAMIYGFIRQSGGYVRLHSRPGHGCRVELYLPVAEESVADEAQGVAVLEPPQGGGEVVLVVEDEPAVRLLVTDALGELGYVTREAADGPAALTLLTSDERIDLMVTDVGLPGLNGRQLSARARATRPEMPVLFMTGYADSAWMEEGGMEAGMDVIGKPFALGALAAKVRAMLEDAAPR